jgi:hypothetical protein
MKQRLLKSLVLLILAGACSDNEEIVMMRVINVNDKTIDKAELLLQKGELLFTSLASGDTSDYWSYSNETPGIPPFFLVVDRDTIYSFGYVFGPVIYTTPPSPLPTGKYTYKVTLDTSSSTSLNYYRLLPTK